MNNPLVDLKYILSKSSKGSVNTGIAFGTKNKTHEWEFFIKKADLLVTSFHKIYL